MKKRNSTGDWFAIMGLTLVVVWCGVTASAQDRWSVERAQQWGEEHPWWVGCNYTP